MSAEELAQLDAQTASARLDFLLKQSDMFSHFVKGKSELGYVVAIQLSCVLPCGVVMCELLVPHACAVCLIRVDVVYHAMGCELQCGGRQTSPSSLGEGRGSRTSRRRLCRGLAAHGCPVREATVECVSMRVACLLIAGHFSCLVCLCFVFA